MGVNVLVLDMYFADIWRLEVIQPMRERNPDSLKEESYAPHLREALLEDDTHT